MTEESPLCMVRAFLRMLLSATLLLLVFSGCGYRLQGRESLPFEVIAIERIENKTVEPKLEDRLYDALAEELLRKGISVHPDAGYKLSGSINRFDLRLLSEQYNVAGLW